MDQREAIGDYIKTRKELLQALSLNIERGCDERELKKFKEVVGFIDQVLQIIESFPCDKEVVFLDCSCGKSYLSFVMNDYFRRHLTINAFFYGVDTNEMLVEKCNRIRDSLGYDNMHFISSRIIDVQLDKSVDLVIALHACDIATDETIAKGIKLAAKYIIVVPCCENQIRSRLKSGHPLVDLTDFGLLRYRFADILTEALRAQFLSGAGYFVKLVEVTSPKYTPKNLMIIARKKKGVSKFNMGKYEKLDEMFNTEFVLKDFFEEETF